MDPRAVRSGRSLRAALLRLLERRSLEQITVREITDEAPISYATFFRHYRTKEELLDDLAADEVDRLVALALPVLDRADGRAGVAALCGYVDGHRALWRTLLTGGAAAAMRTELLAIARGLAAERAPEGGRLPVPLAVRCAVSLIFETLAWWLGEPDDAVGTDEAADILHHLLADFQLTETRRSGA